MRGNGIETFVRSLFSWLNKLILLQAFPFQHLLRYHFLLKKKKKYHRLLLLFFFFLQLPSQRKWMFLWGGEGNISHQGWGRKEREGMLLNIGFNWVWIFLLNLNRVGQLGGFYLLLIGYVISNSTCKWNKITPQLKISHVIIMLATYTQN